MTTYKWQKWQNNLSFSSESSCGHCVSYSSLLSGIFVFIFPSCCWFSGTKIAGFIINSNITSNLAPVVCHQQWSSCHLKWLSICDNILISDSDVMQNTWLCLLTMFYMQWHFRLRWETKGWMGDMVDGGVRNNGGGRDVVTDKCEWKVYREGTQIYVVWEKELQGGAQIDALWEECIQEGGTGWFSMRGGHLVRAQSNAV